MAGKPKNTLQSAHKTQLFDRSKTLCVDSVSGYVKSEVAPQMQEPVVPEASKGKVSSSTAMKSSHDEHKSSCAYTTLLLHTAEASLQSRGRDVRRE